MSHITLKNLVAQRPDLKRRKKVGRTVKPVRPSRKNELWYKTTLRAIVAQIDKATKAELLPFLKINESTYAKDATASEEQLSEELKLKIDKLAKHFAKAIKPPANRIAHEASRRALQHTDAALSASIKSSLGVDISGALTESGDVAQALIFHTAANVDLIESIPNQYFEKLQDLLLENLSKGLRFSDMADSIQHVTGVTDSRADLIARDQTSKMNGAFNEVRQTDLGIEGYIWQGAEDERERETHLANEGMYFSWSSPPELTGHPGEDIQCRCVAIPYFNL